ncbi:MAG: hypothetical protein Q4E33_02545 [Erysipelotrichaceae bacterium]|nr:hypothetical protein [Erysipelotrichaceae bacterium]
MKYKVLKGSDNPLSSDVALIDKENYLYVFEVGNTEDIVQKLNNIDKEKIVIISHFHPDHMANLDKVNYSKLIVGDNTYKYTKRGEIVGDDMYIDGLHIFKIPSCHAKGSIGLEHNEYVFIGDALAPTNKNNEYVYNVQMLKEEIDLFAKLKGKYFVSSHNMEHYQTKDEVIKFLNDIYSCRTKNNPYIHAKI